MASQGPTFSNNGLTVYFESRRAGWEVHLATRLVEFIDGTKQSLDCAIYDLRHPAVLAALVRIASSGKRLRIAFDASKERTGGMVADPKPSGTEQALQATGLMRYATAVHHGRHLMHDKFLVRDGRDVWTGSANFTVGGLEQQDNQCLTAASPQLAARYTAVFDALLTEHRHPAPGAPRAAMHHRGTPGGSVALGGATLMPYFAPATGEGVEEAVMAALKNARRVRVLAFLISDPGILETLAPFGANPSFDIQGIYDPHGMQDVLRNKPGNPAQFWFVHDPRFFAAPSHPFNPKGEQDFMHNKVLIVDDRLVVMGSYNFSENAETNDENLITIESGEVAAAYTAYFDALYAAYGGARRTAGLALAERSLGPRAHVLALRDVSPTTYNGLSLVRSAGLFDSESEVGRTTHLEVFSDGSATGDASARAVLATAEADYAAVSDWFGGIDLPAGQEGDDVTVPRTALPLHVLMDPQAGGAFHFGCAATDLYIEPTPELATGFMVAELVEVFEAAAGNGWDCGLTNGEGLSRVLAAERNPALAADLVPTMQQWWGNGHQDFVTTNNADDRNQDANGCGTIFLYYLHAQLGQSWQQIATTGGTSLGECYQALTGNNPDAGFQDFIVRLTTLDQNGILQLPDSGNPFPISDEGLVLPGKRAAAAGRA